MRKQWLTSVIVMLAITLTGCKKYPEDNALHLSSAKSRITNTWRVNSYLENDIDKTAYWNLLFPNYVLEIKKNNTFSAAANGQYCIGSFCVPIALNESGTWSFSSNKSDLILTYTNTGASQTLHITKLTSKELWLTENTNGITKKLLLSAQ